MNPRSRPNPICWARPAECRRGFGISAIYCRPRRRTGSRASSKLCRSRRFDFHVQLRGPTGGSSASAFVMITRGAKWLEAPPVPSFLEPLRLKIGEAFDRPAGTFEQVLINEYRPGAGIGWHRDKPQFAEVVGVSLLAPCNFRLRRKSGKSWDRFSLTVESRSAYLMTGPSRTVWEHSIPPLDRHRYSITFRTFAGPSTR